VIRILSVAVEGLVSSLGGRGIPAHSDIDDTR
jgi:hypothetical protein